MLEDFVLNPSTAIILISSAALLTIYGMTKRSHLPPSPGWSLPVIGHLYMMESNPRKQFLDWGKRLGPLVSLKMGSHLAVVLYGYDTIKEAFVKHADVFSNRPKTFITQILGKDKGFVTSTNQWKKQRKVGSEILRHLGLGSNVMEEKVQEGITELIDQLDKSQCALINPRRLISLSISRIITTLVFGQDFRYKDEQMAECASLIGDQVSLLEGAAVLNFLPFLRHLPGDIFKLQKVLATSEKLEEDLIAKQIQLRQESSDLSEDFICCYLKKIRENGKKQDSAINEENLVMVVSNLFAAGTETTCTTLCWALLYLLHHPDVYAKCYRDIVSHLGTETRPRAKDQHYLKYISATIMEVQRISSIAPFSLYHSASRDIMFKDYLIPKGTIIIPSLDSVLLSEEVWGDPRSFRPERFLDAAGQELIDKEEFIPFSIGNRACLGKALAKMELFLFLTSLVQRYTISVPQGASLPSLKDRFGLSCSPLPFEICFVPRNSSSQPAQESS
ncbi:cytochrome P450 2C31-like isoform X1 [Biomphalaria glabrata]|uniref:Cytochrome P450 2C31-like isoform X1 n=1 Tax=Biomphalaria glabrata TaxID=6526 RepID=A0A9W3AQZ6_BIOGL|nr:cytochrome P450 2C31-like isoform X1 [Biomphalaria glabrata]XP_055889686.1 cytochrome P450 2C31-like isoform X1 [Biomphalaria glabrata]XP_055889687.1 cytochrome P450 2C31-like isoform X1 [Biomphalaria glabrata]